MYKNLLSFIPLWNYSIFCNHVKETCWNGRKYKQVVTSFSRFYYVLFSMKDTWHYLRFINPLSNKWISDLPEVKASAVDKIIVTENRRRHKKKLWEKEKTFVNSIFSFPYMIPKVSFSALLSWDCMRKDCNWVQNVVIYFFFPIGLIH